MGFVTGMMLVDAPASALNNAGQEEGARTDNTIAVKRIRTRAGDYPYVSAQAVRYWLRTSLERSVAGWKAAPVRREAKIAYVDGDPIEWWDDDLFGYMRAPSKKADAAGSADQPQLSPVSGEITRISPLRMGTLVSLAPVSIVDDFGTMARHDGDPVPHEHQFYKATLQGLFSLNLTTAGTFFHGGRVGYRNLDDNRVSKAQKAELRAVKIHGQPAYRLSSADRAKRVATLVRAIGELEGGAKPALHYTDVTPGVLITAVTKAGNHPFSRVFRANNQREPEVVLDAVKEVLRVYKDQLLSKVFVGWAKGYLDNERAKVEALTEEERSKVELHWGHPREVMAALAKELEDQNNSPWYD